MISVVIPCRNEVQHIEQCVRAIYANDTGETDIEVLIVDGLSDDGTTDVIKRLIDEFPRLSLIENQRQVTPVAFNLGIKAARGDYVQIVGARQFISPNYLQGAVECFEKDPKIWCVGGQVNNIYQNEVSELIAKAMDTRFGVGVGNYRIKQASSYVDTVGTPMYKKEVFETIGYFDEALARNQDDEFNYRVKKAGGEIYYCDDISLQYVVRASFENLYRQYFQYGYWKVFVNKKHRAVTTLRQLAPAALLSFVVLGGIAALFSSTLRLLWLAGLAVYFVGALAAAWPKSDGARSLFQTMYVFFILHGSYGAGYLKGIWDFLLLNKTPADSASQMSR